MKILDYCQRICHISGEKSFAKGRNLISNINYLEFNHENIVGNIQDFFSIYRESPLSMVSISTQSRLQTVLNSLDSQV